MMRTMKMFLHLIITLSCQIVHSKIIDFTTLVTFGDSKSDTGNAYRLSNGSWPPVPPFNRHGGCADDLLWNQILVEQFFYNSTLEDFACAGATTDNRLVQGMFNRNHTKAPGVRQQIDQYIEAKINQTIDFDRTLFIMWVGMDNYIFNQSLTPIDTVQNLLTSLNQLIIFGARNLIVFNQPPYDRFPKFRNRTTTNATRILCLQHNQILFDKMNETYFSSNTRLNIRLFDSYTLISNVLNSYLSYGFETLDYCWDTESSSTVIVLCTNISRHVFADEFHLTSTMQMLIAKEFFIYLSASQNITVPSASRIEFCEMFIFFFCVVFLTINYDHRIYYMP